VVKKIARILALGCVLCGDVPLTAADDVHLDNGEVIEGRATRTGDKVTIELESGQISLSAESVKRVEKRESRVERYEKAYQKLSPNAVAERMKLADYCRDHGMRERERALLQQVIEREPNHEQARTRLGYVKTPEGWVTSAEHMRARGHVQRDGQWLSREQAQELDRRQDQARAAANESQLESKKVALEREKLQLERERLELDRTRAREAERARQAPVFGYFGYGYVPHQRDFRGPAGHTQGRGYDASRVYPINGVRDPRDNTWAIPGVRNPRDTLP
jgi:hypothetical protein